MGLWNNLSKNVNRMEKNASDMKMLENDPEQFRADRGGHLGTQLIMLLVAIAVLGVVMLTGR